MYADHAEKLAKAINKVFWNEQDGFYYDRDEKTGETIKIKSVAGFLPMWAGVASPAQARRLVRDHLLNLKEFWLDYPVATYAKSEPEFYEGSRSGECNWEGPASVSYTHLDVYKRQLQRRRLQHQTAQRADLWLTPGRPIEGQIPERNLHGIAVPGAGSGAGR